MNKNQLCALGSAASLIFGTIWMAIFTDYPLRAIGFISAVLSGFLFIEFGFDREPNEEKDDEVP